MSSISHDTGAHFNPGWAALLSLPLLLSPLTAQAGALLDDPGRFGAAVNANPKIPSTLLHIHNPEFGLDCKVVRETSASLVRVAPGVRWGSPESATTYNVPGYVTSVMMYERPKDVAPDMKAGQYFGLDDWRPEMTGAMLKAGAFIGSPHREGVLLVASTVHFDSGNNYGLFPGAYTRIAAYDPCTQELAFLQLENQRRVNPDSSRVFVVYSYQSGKENPWRTLIGTTAASRPLSPRESLVSSSLDIVDFVQSPLTGLRSRDTFTTGGMVSIDMFCGCPIVTKAGIITDHSSDGKEIIEWNSENGLSGFKMPEVPQSFGGKNPP